MFFSIVLIIFDHSRHMLIGSYANLLKGCRFQQSVHLAQENATLTQIGRRGFNDDIKERIRFYDRFMNSFYEIRSFYLQIKDKMRHRDMRLKT